MRYKIAGIVVCIIAILISTILPTFYDPTEQRYHQHLMAEEKAECSHDADTFCTHLPLVEIDTDGVEIPGRVAWLEDGTAVRYTTTADGQDFITCHVSIVDQEGLNNHTEDAPSVESKATIHVRGNSSRAFDKSNYSLNFITEDGKNNPQSVMGMDAHHEWILHGPFLDKTLMRNYMWYNIGGEIMEYAPNVRFCEVMLNGEYQGVYVMMESITAGQNGARLELSVDRKDNTFTGYLLRLDRGSTTEIKNINHFTKYTYRADTMLNIVYPGTSNLTPELAEEICQDFSAFEKALYSYDYDNQKYGYQDNIDMDSFVDYFILNEFTSNHDAGIYSTYVYKDLDGKLKMCIWDFNNACDNYQEAPVDPQGFVMQNGTWFEMLVKDEDFTDAIIRRYRQLRKTLLNEEKLDAYIDDVIAYLGPAIDRNYEKWGYSFTSGRITLYPKDRNPENYADAITDLKRFLHQRGRWLDENIETLRQYSAESKVKKFNENPN